MTRYAFILMIALLWGCTQTQTPDTRADPSTPTTTTEAQIEGRGTQTEAWWQTLPRPEWAAFERVHPDIDWFEIYALRPQVYAIYEPHHFEEVISFLIIGEEKALLFDTGLGIGNIRTAIRRLTDKPVIVVNSHAHFDHIGDNYRFLEVWGYDSDYANTRQVGMSNTDVADYVNPAWFRPDKIPAAFTAQSYEIRPYSLSGRLIDGQIIDLGKRRLRVMHAPGHSPDSIALFDAENRQLFIGDTFYLAPLYAHLEGSDFNQYHKSAQILSALMPAIDDVFTAHNVPIVPSAYLARMQAAFEAVAQGDIDYKATDGAREYDFDDFSILTLDPPFPTQP